MSEIFAARPELVQVIDAYFWSYPHSPDQSRRRLKLIGALWLVMFVVVFRYWRHGSRG